VNNPVESKRPFGLVSATCLVIANMIGAGVFTTSGYSFGSLGDRQFVMLAWLIGGAIAICGAISYGQLAQRITESGGEYLFLSRLVHPSIGFVAGWVSLIAGFTGAIAYAATAFESYAIPDSIRPQWLLPGVVGIGAIVLFGLLHSLVVKTGLVAQNVVVAIKLILLIGFIAFAFTVFPGGWDGYSVATPPVEFSIFAIASTLVWISLSFSGFNAAVYVTGEVDNPKRNVPRALLGGTILVTIFYIGLNFIFLYGAAPDDIKGVKEIAAVAASALGGSTLATLVRIIVSFALLSSVSSMIIAGPRVYAKMADDGVFPRFFDTNRQGHRGSPAMAIWLQVFLASILVYFSTLKSLLDYLGFTLSVSAALTVACILWTKRDADTGAHRVLFSSIAFVYVASTLFLATLSAINQPLQVVWFLATIVTGVLGYFLFQWFSRTENNT
jgi:APA family basic amino acid/polyamine antiporter